MLESCRLPSGLLGIISPPMVTSAGGVGPLLFPNWVRLNTCLVGTILSCASCDICTVTNLHNFFMQTTTKRCSHSLCPTASTLSILDNCQPSSLHTLLYLFTISTTAYGTYALESVLCSGTCDWPAIAPPQKKNLGHFGLSPACLNFPPSALHPTFFHLVIFFDPG